MRAIIREIREQPQHIRKIFMWSSVLVISLLVGFVWFEETSSDVVALLGTAGRNGSEYTQTAIAQSSPEPKSPFASIKDSFSGLQANLSQLLRGKQKSESDTIIPVTTLVPVPPQRLP